MKALPEEDFRSKRLMLEPSDFALGSEEPDVPPSDLIDQGIWRSMTSLQDDVSIRTSDHYGSELKSLWELWSEWNCLSGALQKLAKGAPYAPISHFSSDAGDEFQASVCNALVGFYRVAFSCLRSVIEQTTVGTQLE